MARYKADPSKSKTLIIPKATFRRLIKQVAQSDTRTKDFRWQSIALLVLQEATEEYIISLLSDAQLAAVHGKRDILKQDIILARRFRGEL